MKKIIVSVGVVFCLLFITVCSTQRATAQKSGAPSTAAQAAFYRGDTALDAGNWELAITEYTEAIKIDPNWAVMYNNRGRAYYEKGDYDRAITDYTQALRLAPNVADGYYNRGHAYAKKGDLDRAIADFEAALRINPNYTEANKSLQLTKILKNLN